MKAKLTIVRDSFSSYLEAVYRTVSDPSNDEAFLKNAAQELQFDYIDPLMPKWNPNLMFSPLERKNNHFSTTGGKSTLELVYTGFTEEARHEGLEKIYWEFGDPYEHILERDYAYYQETGVDKFAPKPDQEAPRFKGHHYVKRGTERYLNRFYERTQAYAMALLQNDKIQSEDRIGRQGYIDDFFANFDSDIHYYVVNRRNPM